MQITRKSLVNLIIIVCLSGCMNNQSPSSAVGNSTESNAEVPTLFNSESNNFHNIFNDNIVWAINFGGDDYLATNGVSFKRDKGIHNLKAYTTAKIYGSQDSKLYKSYVEGPLSIEKPLPNGVYDITFLFAEPSDLDVGKRVFDVKINGKYELTNIDIRGLRDGKAFSALDKTVQAINVSDEVLNIDLSPIKGQPVISGIIVRKHQNDHDNWQLVWQDEFDYHGQPNPAKWSYDEWPARKVNDEDQVYTAREKNVRVENGKLIIEAHKEQYLNGEYTSGRIHTLKKADLHYGRIDVRAKLPAGRGTWSAIWMLPSNPYKYSTTCQPNEDWQGSSTCDAWPNSGEIDIMEHVGFDMHNVHGTVHNKAYYWINWEQRKGAINARNVDKEFHTYSVEWSPEHITVLMDGTPYFSYKNEHTGWQAWPFDHPYHLILNLAIGGMWGRAGGPIDDSIFPVKMEIDYVRMYRNANS
ncbi:hypothetical protein tloyanaT_18950 [Thalassotalea loyana]|uniref:GH16 domain-containing protein n=2 Tax=Thalassotalea loyana TaxID=280483 RepID=A0ABQ6HC11_9GAMM|nr:hypothetical protein tloyanaT_18950 [Thalassotalea loyana]